MIVGIITRNRPKLLRRCLTNLAANARRFGHSPQFIVVSDGVTAENDGADTSALASIDAPPVHVNRFVRESVIHAAMDSGAPEDLVRWALGRNIIDAFQPGAARNVLLLLAAGQKLLMVDDDTTGNFVSFSNGSAPVASGGPDPTWFRLFQDRASALAAAPMGDVDGLGLHRNWLDQFPLTHSGVVGHSGMQNPEYAARGMGAHMLELARTREVHRFVTAPTTTPIWACQTICVGLRGDVPPFPPHHYAEDGAFGAAMRATNPGQHAVFLPVAAIHDPDDGRPAPNLTKTVRANDVLAMLLGACVPGPMQSVGDQLIALSRAGFFEEMVANLAEQAKPGSTVAPEFGGSILRLSEYVERYGRLMEAWPQMLRAAASFSSATAGHLTPPLG